MASEATDERLASAYRSTTYRALTPRGEIALRVGEHSSLLAALLEEYRTADWAFITACNPRSTRRTRAENRSAQARLLAALRACNAIVFPGEGAADSGGWDPEESYLVLGLAAERALALAREFEQHAILAGRGRDPARLLWTGI